jgi:predicted MFS family arabinose efflux permease
MSGLSRRDAVLAFLAFAFAYFFSTLIRAITATLSPTLTQEFSLNARDLGLLAGGYFLGFAATQLPLGAWLDRHGPKKVILYFLTVAVVGCLAFSMATSFSGLLAARVLCGVGVSACLMAPLTAYRRWFDASTLMRANSWMLMTGALGMVASTLPVQWLVPVVGWRALFWALALLVLLAMLLIAWLVPRWDLAPVSALTPSPLPASYAEILRHPYFRKMAPLGFFCYGGQVAMQTLWAAPWMVKVAGYTPLEAASGLFWINVTMLVTFWGWGMLNPGLARRGFHADRLIALGLPFSFLILAIIIIAESAIGIWAAALWALYCMGCSFAALAQPAVGMAFPAALAGRALSAYNLVIFVGVFVVQWGIGLAVDGFKSLGWNEVQSFQWAMSVFLLCSVAAYGYFLHTKSHNQPH